MPEDQSPMTAPAPASRDAYHLLTTRRSVKTRDMTGPGPDRADVEKILTAATRVPDHGKLTPWRFHAFIGDDRQQLADLLHDAMMAEEGSERKARAMADYALQTPAVVLAISTPSMEKPIPAWEQHLSMGAACQTLLIAAHSLGFVGQWLTGWAATSPTVAAKLGLGGMDRIAGYLFLGSPPDTPPTERERPALEDVATFGLPHTSHGA
ncbi:nitroreductase family protein [Yunchengibacter salinarum]|uniref:nitroreductase family protein n=1 Tax=Yunchengibacter salinarum TaxID=3133399 RepID=UPI0035B6A826